MNTCRTCRHWRKVVESDPYNVKDVCQPLDPDTYKPMVVPFEVRLCESPRIVYFERQPDSRWVSLVDGSNYLAKMLTGGDFGCVNHEAEA